MTRLILLFAAALACFADAGIIIPSTRKAPDRTILSLEEMQVDIKIDNADALVSVRQIFQNRQGAVLEGTYSFSMPARAAISDFAVWDGVTRIPGVILERRRAEEIYENLKMQAIDPGLLQQGERDETEARRGSMFVAKIVPIPAYGTKRVEMEYHERIPVEDLKSFFALPLRPDAYQAQVVSRLTINFELRSSHPLREFEAASKTYPLQIRERTANLVRGSFEGRNVTMAEDFAVRYAVDGTADRLAILTYRDPATKEPGVFEATAVLAPSAQSATGNRTVIALFDNSLSMQWEKLERSYQALETLLRSLKSGDRFNVILFNTDRQVFQPKPAAADPAVVESALQFVKASKLRGGTNLQSALDAALAQSSPDAYIVVLSDGGATRGLIQNRKLAEWYAAKWNSSPKPHTYFFAIGDDANLGLVKQLAHQNGLWEWVRSTEPVEFKLNAFISKIGRRPVDNLKLNAQPASNLDLIYPLEETVFAGGMAAWVGQYKQPVKQASFAVRGAKVTAALPDQDLSHPGLPRTWAKARVDALLDKIEREGEDRATIDEIIRLSRKYKFVTPYTSFLAAPRSLLRPRVIRPGDPVLRVRTDPSIASVVAMFPFGLVKPLRYLEGEDIWQTRFFAPSDMADGTHRVRLILRDKKGQVFREWKTFVVASKPPTVRVKLDRTSFRRGETVRLRAAASDTTRTVIARMYGVGPVYLRWNPQAASNTGDFVVPAHLPAGRYTLTVTAEDFAHNIGSQEVSIEVVP
jgi:Ca-activated chloride channel family protein